MPFSDPLLAAILYRSSSTVEKLLENGCNPDGTEAQLIKPLEIACQNNDLPTTKLLLRKGATVNSQNKYGETALHLASYNEVSYELFDAILKSKADIYCKDYGQKTALHIVCDEFNELKVKAILKLPQPPVNEQDDEGATPIHMLINTNAGKDVIMNLLKIAMQKGFDVNVQTDAGETILHVASQEVNSEELLSALLTLKDIDPTLQDKSGDNFLHSFIRYRRGIDCSEEFLCRLLDGKSLGLPNETVAQLVNQQNESGFLPLSSYIFKGIVNMTAIRKFIDYLDNVDTQENFGHSLLHIALESAIKRNEKLHMVKYLLCKRASVNIKDKFGRTPLFYARSLSIVKLLIDNGANIHCTDQCKRSPLIALLRTCNPNICQYLINKGSRIESTDKFGSNALHYAAWENRVREMQILIKAGINIFQKDRTGRTPYDIATFWRCKEAANLLKDAMTNLKTVSLKRKVMQQKEYADIDDVLWTPRNRTIVHNDYQTIKQLRTHFDLPDELEEYIHKVVNLPGVGITHMVEEAVWVEKAVVSLVKAIALRIGELDNRFRCKVFRSGSTFEDTKIEDPDEFDFLFVLSEFSKLCAVEKAADYDFNSKGYVSLVFNDTKMNDSFKRYFDYYGLLICGRLRNDFFILLRRAISNSNIWLSDEIFIDAFTIRNQVDKPIVNFHLFIIGSSYKGFHVSIDVVPALQTSSWWPDGANLDTNKMVTKSILNEGCLLLCQEPDEMRDISWESGQSPYFRISCAPAEIKLMQSFPLWIRRTYAISKMMKSNFMCPKIKFEKGAQESSSVYPGTQRYITVSGNDNISSYMLKNCLFHIIAAKPKLLQELPFPDKSLLYNSIHLALRIYENLSKAAASKTLPVYFLPYINILEMDDADREAGMWEDIERSEEDGSQFISDACEMIQTFSDFIMKLNQL